jgi:hypothetical protein
VTLFLHAHFLHRLIIGTEYDNLVAVVRTIAEAKAYTVSQRVKRRRDRQGGSHYGYIIASGEGWG